VVVRGGTWGRGGGGEGGAGKGCARGGNVCVGGGLGVKVKGQWRKLYFARTWF
jgi:hypothetical protein